MKTIRLWTAGLALALTLVMSQSGWAAGSTHAYLMRGIFNVSTGLDALAVKLGKLGVASTVYSHSDESGVIAAATRDYKAGKVRSIVLIGHSLGAGAVLSVARDLNTAGIPVSLVISLDPVFANSVAANVRRAVNYYVSGTGVPLTKEPGFRGDLKNIDLVAEPGMDHMAVQATDKMHARMIGFVRGAVGGATAAKPKDPAPAGEKHVGIAPTP